MQGHTTGQRLLSREILQSGRRATAGWTSCMQVENNNSGRDVASCTVPVRTRASPSPAPAKIEMCTIFGICTTVCCW